MKQEDVAMRVQGLRAMAIMLVACAATVMGEAADVLYENDFATRRSETAPPHSVWAIYEYDKGGPVAYDYNSLMADLNLFIGMYAFGDPSDTYSQQDGWFKKVLGTSRAYRYQNLGRTSVTDEDDPALVHSTTNSTGYGAATYDDATNKIVFVFHPLRNVFTNGVIAVQFDIRQPNEPSNTRRYSWLRLVTENDMKCDVTDRDGYVIEAGLNGLRLSAAWMGGDGKRKLNTLAVATELHWYRYYVTCDLDAQTSSITAYDLGLSRIPMDTVPNGSPHVPLQTGCPFYKTLDADTGGISGIGMRFAYVNTCGVYGDAGFDPDKAYMYDNIKVAWKAPGATSFTECYRNDFSKSMRRTIDGSGELVHSYAQTENSETSTFAYGSDLVRASSVLTQTGKPYLPAAFETADTPQKPGIDGWRFSGRVSMTGALAVTTNGANRVGFLSRYCQCLQPMCEDVTNGVIKMEFDMRTPQSWNARAVQMFLTNNRGYDDEFFFSSYPHIVVGLWAADGSGNTASDPNSFSVVNSTATKVYDTNPSWADKFKALEWYRIQLFVDLDATNYWYHVYDIGTSAPSDPDGYDSTDVANAIASSERIGFYVSSKPTTDTNPIRRLGYGIGAYGFLNWQNPTSKDMAMYFDNVRLWTTNAVSGGWDLVFKNDFSTTVRNYARRSVKLQKTPYIDRPEYGEDGWAAMPTYTNCVYVAGANPALCSSDRIFSLVHPIGQGTKNGILHAQYDVRLPFFWHESMEYVRIQLGGGAMASASTWTTSAYRCGSHRTIRMEFRANSSADSVTGIKNQTDITVQDGTGDGGNGTSLKKKVDGSYAGHWIRMKINADMGSKTWSCSAYDMGASQPTLATTDGDLLQSWNGLHFNFNEPITHLHMSGGYSPSYAPWRDDVPGGVLVDNIRIVHTPRGIMFTIR